jgi:hypothetical protein
MFSYLLYSKMAKTTTSISASVLKSSANFCTQHFCCTCSVARVSGALAGHADGHSQCQRICCSSYDRRSPVVVLAKVQPMDGRDLGNKKQEPTYGTNLESQQRSGDLGTRAAVCRNKTNDLNLFCVTQAMPSYLRMPQAAQHDDQPAIMRIMSQTPATMSAVRTCTADSQLHDQRVKMSPHKLRESVCVTIELHTSAPASQNLGRPTASVKRIPATAIIAQRPFVSSPSLYQGSASALAPRRRGSKPRSPAAGQQAAFEIIRGHTCMAAPWLLLRTQGAAARALVRREHFCIELVEPLKEAST